MKYDVVSNDRRSRRISNACAALTASMRPQLYPCVARMARRGQCIASTRAPMHHTRPHYPFDCLRRMRARRSTGTHRHTAPPHGSPTILPTETGHNLQSRDLQFRADWHFEESEERQHYVIEPWLDGVRIGRAYGWFSTGGKFVLEKIEVDSAKRSRGYGSAVIEQLRLKAREKGCMEFVIKGVRMSNHRAIALYEAMGAKPIQTSDTLLSFVISPP
ncbi:GNAT family N-acetyltransferase [Lysobacter sp. HA18]